tara:strand:+ start:4431 stop:6896 length:2466 start_codon:yes stop_codon:yes gene_type:complete
MKKNSLLFIFSILLATGGVFAQTEAERQEIIANYDLEKLSLLQSEMSEKENLNLQKALAKAELMGWEKRIERPNGGVAVLVGLNDNGNPMYNTTFNREGAITTRTDKVHTGGDAGLDLNGEDMLLGIWEVNGVSVNHPLLEGRVTQIDNPSETGDHATHVSGTMIGSGDVNAGAKGMAPLSEMIAYDSSGAAGEMIAAAANGLLVSNHSYGLGIQFLDLWDLGYYSNLAKSLDNIIYNAPYFTSVWAAGNDRQSGENPGDGGYDYLQGYQTAKNTIIVAAVNEVLNYTGPGSVNMSSFSSWGPTDDGRIKPDISAKGVNMFSSWGNSGYTSISGTSMASPNVAGSLILLQQHYNNVNGAYMRSSTLRGLALHTADEAGTNPGPDYRFGWGLLNIERAAEVITNNGTTSTILEENLDNDEVYTYSVQADGANDLMVSITWIDPAGNLLPNGPDNEDNPTPSLVNDLDLRVSQDGGATFMPWKLDVANFSAAATTGDNLVDNIEKIEIEGASGEYIIQVSHKGNVLINDVQAFSLVVTGISNNEFTVSSHQGILEACIADGSADFNVDLGFNDGFSDTIDFTDSGLPAGTSGSFSSSSLSAEGTTVLTVDGLGSLTPGDYPFMVTGTGSSETINLYLILRILSTDVSDIGLIFPPDEAVDQPGVIFFSWEPGDESVSSYDFELSRSSDFSVVEFSENVQTPQYIAIGVTDGATYYWRVKPNTICAEGNFSEVFMLTVDGVLGLNDQTIEGLAIYPNPAKNLLNLSAITPITNVKIVNALGQILISKTSNSTISQIDVSALSIGNYFISVTSENNTKVLQFLKK